MWDLHVLVINASVLAHTKSSLRMKHTGLADSTPQSKPIFRLTHEVSSVLCWVGHTDLFVLQTTNTVLQSSLQKSVMGLHNKNILPLLGKYCTVEYHGREFILHILLRAGPKMPGLVSFFFLKATQSLKTY